MCSSTAHVKKDCPVKEKGSSKPTKPRSEQSSSTTSGSTPATRAVAGPGDPQQSPTQGQPAAEPSPTTSPSSRGRPGDQQGQTDELKKVIEDASKMLKSMLATQTNAPAASSSTAVPTYESIQRQLDEMKLRAMKVQGGAAQGAETQGVLLDSGSTHVLRPARSDDERESCQAVSVTLAGDERRVLHQPLPGASSSTHRCSTRPKPLCRLGS